MKTNIIREKLKAGEMTVASRMITTSPLIIEALGNAGVYDYIEFLAEYGAFDLHDFDNICRTAELHNMGAMIKVDQVHQAFLAQRGVGAGFDAVLFTDCRSADDARKCVELIAPDTPEDKGLYPSANRRTAITGSGTPEYVQAIRDIVVAIMIEKKAALDNLDAILDVPGIDLIQWGPSDFSMSLGRAGEKTHPEVLDAKKKVYETAIKKGVAPRAEINSPDEAKAYLDMGVRHFCIGTELYVLLNWWTANGKGLRDALAGK